MKPIHSLDPSRLLRTKEVVRMADRNPPGHHGPPRQGRALRQSL